MNTFDSIPIPVGFVLESEAVSAERGLKPRRAVDEERGVFNVAFLPKVPEKPFGESGRFC